MIELTETHKIPGVTIKNLGALNVYYVPNVSTFGTKAPDYDKIFIEQSEYTSVSDIFVIYTGMIPALGHWIYESFIYIFMYISLKESNPSLKLFVGPYTDYKCILCKYIGINPNDILFEYPVSGANCFFPYPSLSLTQRTVNALHQNFIQKVFSHFSTVHLPKVFTYMYTILPRQKNFNYEFNNKKISYDTLIPFFKKRGDLFTVLNTDEIYDFGYQLNIIQSSKNIIVPDGSAFLLNGMFARNSTIYVIGRLCTVEQGMLFPQIQYIYDEIIKTNKNKVYFFENEDTFLDFIQSHVYIPPKFTIPESNRTMERWFT
jgi:hypothetical protein